MAITGKDVIIPGLRMYGHAGDAYGLLSDMFQDPISGFGVIFITNGYKPGHAYTYGVNSAFFLPEEAAFEVFASTSYANCIASNNQ